ncbi:hypothetical protein WH96_16915 [Kiloniella spongiae]|uniref:ABM domain-containing protein n=2 Tax=Kiloniella spongiae TaxID=1489064 RepID=A0A0H2MAL6_9PROT|nr:hypothetical protein WH96_16915 [Kiloniella spongiae]
MYPAHFVQNVIPAIQKVDGFLSADLLSREFEGKIEYTVISRWKSMDAVKAFAGENPSLAVIEPGAVAALESFDDVVIHYEVAVHVS